jgi:hypothetical protein
MVIDTQQAAIDILEATPVVLRALVARLPEEVLEAPADEDWSPKDVVAHFLLTQRLGALDRIKSMVEQDHPLLMNRDENEELGSPATMTARSPTCCPSSPSGAPPPSRSSAASTPPHSPAPASTPPSGK